MEEKKELKIKVSFTVETKDKDGKKTIVKDAVRAKGLDGEEAIITDVVSKLTKYIYATTAQRRDIDLDDFIHGFHNSKGEEFEMTEKQVQFIKEQAEAIYPMMTSDAVCKVLDEALVAAKNDQEAKKVEPAKADKPAKQEDKHKMKFQTTKK
jgi:hypothetical protein